MGRLLAFGDVHGCANTLKVLVDRVKPTEDDKMVFLGDYVDRGDKVFETVEFLIKLKEKFPKTVFLKGNHEDMMLKMLTSKPQRMSGYDDARLFMMNGGDSTMRGYFNESDLAEYEPYEWTFDMLPESHQKFYNELEVMHVDGDFVFVHAGLRHGDSLDEQMEHDVMWVRESFMYNPTNPWGKTVVHGHTPMETPQAQQYHEKYPDRYNVDTACVFGYNLTCLDVNTGFTWKQKCLDERVA
jgi:serine/threonine protein phosphatase 1